MPQGKFFSVKSKAIFMDRDGTVSEEIGYMYHAGLYRPFPWTGEAVRKINESGFKAVLITNQAGVERGYFPESTIHEVAAATAPFRCVIISTNRTSLKYNRADLGQRMGRFVGVSGVSSLDHHYFAERERECRKMAA